MSCTSGDLILGKEQRRPASPVQPGRRTTKHGEAEIEMRGGGMGMRGEGRWEGNEERWRG